MSEPEKEAISMFKIIDQNGKQHGPDWNNGTFETVADATRYLYELDTLGGRTYETADPAIFMRHDSLGNDFELSIVETE